MADLSGLSQGGCGAPLFVIGRERAAVGPLNSLAPPSLKFVLARDLERTSSNELHTMRRCTYVREKRAAQTRYNNNSTKRVKECEV